MGIDYAELSDERSAKEVKEICEEVENRVNGRNSVLTEFATSDDEAVRPHQDTERKISLLHSRTDFQRDIMRIAFTNAYQRLAGKTQCATRPVNDSITMRLIHTERVAQIARSIARALGVNEDLTEAIARAHDIGHPPMGHAGEAFLTRAIYDFNKDLIGVLGAFKHNIHGVHVVDRIARRSGIDDVGLNLTNQVRHGIISHDGERNVGKIAPSGISAEEMETDIHRYTDEIIETSKNIELDESLENDHDIVKESSKVGKVLEGVSITPATLEACIVFITDVIAYSPEDFEDQVVLGVVGRHELPPKVADKFGVYGADMMNKLITDVIIHSYGRNEISYSDEVAELLNDFKANFLYPNYYKINEWLSTQVDDPRVNIPGGSIKKRMDYFFKICNKALEDPGKYNHLPVVNSYLKGMNVNSYYNSMPDDEVKILRAVVDYIAGCTDRYFFEESAPWIYC